MSCETVRLNARPMPYITECEIKEFSDEEYHCRRKLTHYVIIFLQENRLYFTENNNEVVLSAGEWYIQQCSTSQSATRPSPGAKYYYIHFSQDPKIDMYYSFSLPLRGKWTMQRLGTQLEMLRSLSKQIPAQPITTQHLFLDILSFLSESLPVVDPVALAVVKYLHAHYSERITSVTLSEALHYSSEYIEKQMKENFHMTPHAYLRKIRLNAVINELERTTKSIQNMNRTPSRGQ